MPGEQGILNNAVAKALDKYEHWVETTGGVAKGSRDYLELRDIIINAVKTGHYSATAFMGSVIEELCTDRQ